MRPDLGQPHNVIHEVVNIGAQFPTLFCDAVSETLSNPEKIVQQ